MIGIPEDFARYTTEREGESGRRWLATLPDLVSELMDRWGCERDGAVIHGGVGVIVPVRREANQLAAVSALLEEDDLDKAVPHTLDVFAEAAELEYERVRRWARFHAVAASFFWGRRHGFRQARTGAELDELTRLADHLARLLT